VFDFFKKRPKVEEQTPSTIETDQSPTPPPPKEEKTWFSRLKQGLTRTRSHFVEGISSLFLGKKEIDAQLLEELETQLLLADMGVETTQEIIADLTRRLDRKQLTDMQTLWDALQENLLQITKPVQAQPWQIAKQSGEPFVILMIGINGAGKTTTIGKLTHSLQQQGLKVLLAAGDTFRAAAIEQLQTWGERNNVPVISQQQGSDSASVIYDAIAAAKARGYDVIIADTAGRLHTQSNLLDELKKVKRVMQKVIPSAPHEVMLVLDAGIGQNALRQTEEFHQAIGITSLVLTKLDGTAKGGVIFAIAKRFGIPIRFIGVGEQIDDLQIFEAEPFVRALLNGNQ
jgi:fused signal recognition particle receptor